MDDDTIDGGAGADTVDGGSGDDTINGGAGADVLQGGLSFDLINGGADDDFLVAMTLADTAGSLVGDTLNGEDGDDSILGAGGADVIDGGVGEDFIFGGDGDDTITSGLGADIAMGGDGDDLLSAAGFSEDSWDGGEGVDTWSLRLSFLSPETLVVDLSAGQATWVHHTQSLLNIENAIGSFGSDRLIGDAGGNVLDGFLDADTIDGGNGNDTLIGGAGGDSLTGGRGADTFRYLDTADSGGTDLDRIANLAGKDRIDLSQIDAKVNTAGNQKFELVETFTGRAGELVVTFHATGEHAGDTTVEMHVDGDGIADGLILITGDHADFTRFVF